MALVALTLALGTVVLACHPDCVTCNGGGSANQCTSCAPNAYLDSTPRGHCLCMSGASTSTDTQHCLPACAPTCLTCSGALSSQCLSCYPHASGAPGTCTCTSGYFPNPIAAFCSLCDPTCSTCSGGLSSQCLSCKSNANGAPGTCVCLSGFYPNPTSALCAICDVTCTACNSSGASACTVCHAGATLASGPPGPCSCLPGSVPNPSSAHCSLASACDFTCLSCSLPMDSSKCTTCYANASAMPNPGPCICNSNAVPSPDVANCALCHTTCLSCTFANDSSQCTGCYGLATLKGPAPSSCVCPNGTFPSPDVSNCKVCDSTCQSCISPGGPAMCTSCYDFAVLSALSPASTCICANSTYPNPNSAHCAQCHSSCKICVNSGEAGCSQCYSNAYLSGPSPNSCLCSPGFYPNPDASSCSECSMECGTCANSIECLSCKSDAYLSAGQCICSPWTYPSPDASLCVYCPTGCQLCTATGCTQCLSGYYLYLRNCGQTCPQSFLPKAGVCEPGESTPPVPSLYVDITNDLHISFDTEMMLNITSADISVEVTANSSIYNVTWSSPIIESNYSFYVLIRINTTELSIENQVRFTFLHPELVKDIYGISISISTLTGVLSPIGLFPASSNSSVLATRLLSLFGSSSITAALTSSLMSSKSGSIWSILNQMELITFIPMTAIALSSEIIEALNALLLEAMVPDYFKYVQGEEGNCEIKYDFSHNYDVHSRYLLSNVRMMFGAGVALGLFFQIIWLLKRLKVDIFQGKCEEILGYGHWKVPIRWWLQSYLHIFLFSCLQLGISFSSTCLHNAYLDLNLIISLFGLLAALITPIFLLVFLTTYRRKVTTRVDFAFNQHWDELYKHLTPFHSTAYLSPAVFILRRILFGLSIVALSEWPKVQAVVGTALAFAVLLYVTLLRPIEERMEWIGEIIVEIGTFIVFALTACYAFEIDDSLKEIISEITVWAILCSVLCNGVVSMVKAGLGVCEICKEYERKRRVQSTQSLASRPIVAPVRATRVSSIRLP